MNSYTKLLNGSQEYGNRIKWKIHYLTVHETVCALEVKFCGEIFAWNEQI